MLYVKLTWCSGLTWIYGQLEGWGQSVMKLIWCSCLTWIYGQLEEGVSVCNENWCNGLPEIHVQLTGGPSSRSIQYNGLPWIYGQ